MDIEEFKKELTSWLTDYTEEIRCGPLELPPDHAELAAKQLLSHLAGLGVAIPTPGGK